jgi:poly(A) polymerase
MARPSSAPVTRKLELVPWQTNAPLGRVFTALGDSAIQTRIIGGAVRNALLGQPVADIDIATALTPEDVIERAIKAGLAVYPTGLAHGTVTVVADGAAFEVTTLRRDVETDGRHAVVGFTTDWHEDALRRDFTINALSCDARGTIYDTVGGLEDLDARRVRFIGKAEDRITEDYLRILRFFRFTAAYADGEPDARGVAACLALKSGLARLSAERIGGEIMKLIVTPRAGDIAAFMNAGGIFYVLFGQAADPAALRKLQAIEQALSEKPDAVPRLAVLLAPTPDSARTIAARLRFSNSDSDAFAAVTAVKVNDGARLPEHALKVELYRHGEPAFNRAMRLAWARSDAPATDQAWTHKSLLAARWSPPTMPVSGADVLALGIPPGPRIGRALRAFEAWWVEAEFPGDRNAHIARLSALAEQS